MTRGPNFREADLFADLQYKENIIKITVKPEQEVMLPVIHCVQSAEVGGISI